MPHPDRFNEADHGYERAMEAHVNACEAGQQGYQDPVTKLFVMTATYLSDRPCCERGCRHCPYVI